VHEEVEGEEPLTFSQDTPLNETKMEGVQSESTPSSSSEEEFLVSNDNPSCEPSQDVPRERPQRQRKEWPRGWWIVTKEVERATIAFLEEPQNIEEALTCENSKEWECAMQEEYDSLMTNKTWTLVPLPVGRKLVSCKWVFKIKQGANGEPWRSFEELSRSFEDLEAIWILEVQVFTSGAFLEALLEPWRSFKEFGGHLEFEGAQRLDWCSLEVFRSIGCACVHIPAL
jgi:hypothetical protein